MWLILFFFFKIRKYVDYKDEIKIPQIYGLDYKINMHFLFQIF